jgi:uncharacterized protein (TIGR02145 family)
MNKINLFLLPALAVLACVSLQAQVTIGGVTDPAPGALLDLNGPGGVKGGLVLSNVSITNPNKIPAGTNSFPGITAGVNDGNNPAFKGAIVYNTNPDTGMGVYVWTGTQWIPAGTNILYDAQGNDYTIGNFGDAGTWMTQNLRTTEKDYGDNMDLEEGASMTATDKRYNYPGTDTNTIEERKTVFDTHKEYGLLYNWVAASGRTAASGTDTDGLGANPPGTTRHQGICPDGWHLPSDYEWSQLEKEIATNPGKYSSHTEAYENWNDSTVFFPISGEFDWRPINGVYNSVTNWGRQMISTTPVSNVTNGSSKSREAGGFDALLTGYIDGNGLANRYGSAAYFWSSSCDGILGVYRALDSGRTGVYRRGLFQTTMFSVRCKKD